MSGTGGTFHKWESAIWAILFVGVILFGGWLRITDPTAVKRSPDEKFYGFYASKAIDAPLTAPRILVSGYNSSASNWTFPIPLRIGYYYSIAAIIKLWHVQPEEAGVALSTASSILQLVLVALVGLRFFNRWTVLVALALLSVCPSDLAMARRVWGDGVSGCVAMLLVWFCAEIRVRRRAWPWFVAFCISSVYFLLLKESGGVFFGFCVLWLAIESWRQHQSWKRAAWIFAGAGAAAVCSFAIMAAMCGGVSAALETVRHSAQAAPTNGYGTAFQSGPWYSFPLGLWVLSPLTAFGCAAGLFALMLPGNSVENVLSLNRQQRDLAIGMGALIVLVLVAATLPPALKNLRYISFIVGPWYLMAALGLSYTAVRLRKMLPSRVPVPVLGALAAAVVVYCCWGDYASFRVLFLKLAILDLNIRQVVTFPFAEGVM